MSWRPYLEQLAEEVKNAPSIFNSQPWFFKVTDDDRIELYARLGEPHSDYRRRWDLSTSKDGARYLDPLAREFAISCGAALYNLRLAIRVAGHDLAVRLPPHPMRASTLLASVEIMTGRVKAPTVAEQELYEAIWRRHTNRWPHTIVPAPLAIIVTMENAAAQEGAPLRLLHPRQARKWLRLAADADRFFNDEPDLSAIAHKRYQKHQDYRDLWTEEQDGVPRATFGPTPKNRSPIRKPTRKDFWLRDEAERFERPPLLDKGPFERPQLMALSTDDDQILDWLRAGQALQHAILTGTRYSVSPPYGVTAKYHAPYRYGLPGRHHLVRRWRRDLAYDGLSVSLLTQPLERYDIVRYDTRREDTGRKDAERKDAALRPRPSPWRVAELPQVVIRVGYAVRRAGDAQRQPEEEIIVDARLKPPPGVDRARVQLPEPELSELGLHGEEG
jgi:nitroreductase